MAREKLKSLKDLAKLLPPPAPKPVPVPKVKRKDTAKDSTEKPRLPKPKRKKPKPEAKRGILPKTVASFKQDLGFGDLSSVYHSGLHGGNTRTASNSDLFLFKNELQRHGLELFGSEIRVIEDVVTELKGTNAYDMHTCELITQYQRRFDQNFRGR